MSIVSGVRIALGFLLFLSLSASAAAQIAEEGLRGNWKYLRSFVYVQVDDQDRVFQCRIMPDLNVLVSTGKLEAGGIIQWQPVRFFSLYGKEVSPSLQDWGRNTMELRTRVMFLTAPTLSGQSTERMEFDKVPDLPTICDHYRASEFE